MELRYLIAGALPKEVESKKLKRKCMELYVAKFILIRFLKKHIMQTLRVSDFIGNSSQITTPNSSILTDAKALFSNLFFPVEPFIHWHKVSTHYICTIFK